MDNIALEYEQMVTIANDQYLSRIKVHGKEPDPLIIQLLEEWNELCNRGPSKEKID